MTQTFGLTNLSNKDMLLINGGDTGYIDPNSAAYKAGQAAREAAENAGMLWGILTIIAAIV
jgi:hypothetical protein